MRFHQAQTWGKEIKMRSDWPVLSSRGTLPDLCTCRWSLALLRYNQTAPPCLGRSKVNSRPALFHVRNWSPTDMPTEWGSVTPGKRRKLRGLAKVMATNTGSAHEKVTFPWDRWRNGEGEKWGRDVITAKEGNMIMHKCEFQGCMAALWRRDLISPLKSASLFP